MITIERIKNIVEDIKADKEWINDSESKAEHRGICMGLDLLINHLEETKEQNQWVSDIYTKWKNNLLT